MVTITTDMLTQARAAQESIMDASVIVESGPGTVVFDPDTGAELLVPDPPLYTGPGKVQALNKDARTVIAGAQDVTVADHVCVVPWTVTGVTPDTRIIVVASPDPYLVGRTLTVKGVSGNDMVTARRLVCILNQD